MSEPDPWEEPAAKAWATHVFNDMVPKVADSSVVVSLVPPNEGDVKFWVELGASIMMGKPIIIVAFDDRTIPPKLELVADEVVRCPRGVDPAASEDLAEAIRRVLPQ